mmetsp:Transcript_4750/g.9478  ORF Transcript_4750/g.9478 Transcript_4750/m.9478 type:complete len:214 (-) Transcript_4750:447-1088(-)
MSNSRQRHHQHAYQRRPFLWQAHHRHHHPPLHSMDYSHPCINNRSRRSHQTRVSHPPGSHGSSSAPHLRHYQQHAETILPSASAFYSQLRNRLYNEKKNSSYTQDHPHRQYTPGSPQEAPGWNMSHSHHFDSITTHSLPQSSQGEKIYSNLYQKRMQSPSLKDTYLEQQTKNLSHEFEQDSPLLPPLYTSTAPQSNPRFDHDHHPHRPLHPYQ